MYTYEKYKIIYKHYNGRTVNCLSEDEFCMLMDELQEIDDDYTEGAMYRYHNIYCTILKDKYDRYLELRKQLEELENE